MKLMYSPGTLFQIDIGLGSVTASPCVKSGGPQNSKMHQILTKYRKIKKLMFYEKIFPNRLA